MSAVVAPVEAVPLSEQAYRQLLDAIVWGRLAPGERLRDVDLADGMGVSRTPVREALRRLEDEGLVETVPRVSVRVTPVDAERTAQAVPVIAALHALGARLGVPALDSGDLERMVVADDLRNRALEHEDVVAAIEADDRFHAVALQASHNDELIRALERLMPQIRRLDVLHFAELTRRGAAADHAAILAACRRGDADEAARHTELNFLRLADQLRALRAADG